MNILELFLQRYDQGMYVKKYFQRSIEIPAGIGSESDAIRVITAESLKTFTSSTAELWESLSSEYQIENDLANWSLIASGASELYPLSRGASYLKIVNTSNSLPAILEVTGV